MREKGKTYTCLEVVSSHLKRGCVDGVLFMQVKRYSIYFVSGLILTNKYVAKIDGMKQRRRRAVWVR
uniref:Mrr_cat domain-containing protein n=1 Tax=Strongyloides venezuelensis TaxID=75913 RepID=A0A0K0FD98_STRVS